MEAEPVRVEDIILLPLGVLSLTSLCFLACDIARGIWNALWGPIPAPTYDAPPQPAEVTCLGCGAPIDWHEFRCPYCRRDRP